jgi:hypothetical protein
LGANRPQIDDPSLKRLLLLNHHLWSNRPEFIWVGEPAPGTFQIVGSIPLTKKEMAFDSCTHAAWESLPLQRLLQWRWEHDRNAMLAEEAVEEAEAEKKREAEAARRASILAKTDLPMIQARRTLFPRWKRLPKPAVKRAIEEPIRKFIASVIGMKKPNRREVTRELRNCAKALNEIDTELDHPIETVERDDICELFDEILTVAKHPDLLEKLDEWREW